jgi:hypothetical protein
VAVAEGTGVVEGAGVAEVPPGAGVPGAGVGVHRIGVKEVAGMVGTVDTALVPFLGLRGAMKLNTTAIDIHISGDVGNSMCGGGAMCTVLTYNKKSALHQENREKLGKQLLCFRIRFPD